MNIAKLHIIKKDICIHINYTWINKICHVAYFSASPPSVRPEIKIGSKGSSVPEIVTPRGPPCRRNSTVYVIELAGSTSSVKCQIFNAFICRDFSATDSCSSEFTSFLSGSSLFLFVHIQYQLQQTTNKLQQEIYVITKNLLL